MSNQKTINRRTDNAMAKKDEKTNNDLTKRLSNSNTRTIPLFHDAQLRVKNSCVTVREVKCFTVIARGEGP